MFSLDFVKYAADRALKSAAQAVLALMSLDSVNVLTVDWVQVGAAAATYALVSVLTSVVAWTGVGKTEVVVVENVSTPELEANK